MAFGRRIGRVKPFINVLEREDGRYVGFQAGIVTFHGKPEDETYKVAYLETGGRIDHLGGVTSPLVSETHHHQRLSNPTGEDSLYLEDDVSAFAQQNHRITAENAAYNRQNGTGDEMVIESNDGYEGDIVTIDPELEKLAISA